MLKKLLEKYPVLLSSTGEGLSLRLKSFVGLVVTAGGLIGLGLSSDALIALADQIGVAYDALKEVARGIEIIVGALGSLFSVAKFVQGWFRAKTYKELGLGKYAR